MSAHPHAENMRLYAEDAAETDKPWERWERRYVGPTYGDHAEWTPCTPSECWWSTDWEYRRKPKPLECWVAEYENGYRQAYFSRPGSIKESVACRLVRVVHMREVTE